MERTFKFPPGCSVASITIRETNGKDEAQALQQAEQKGGLHHLSNELLRLSIVKVDGKAVTPPLDIESWNTKTRTLARAAYNALNSVDDAAIASFLDAPAAED